ncbi:MAG: ABC transporter substrate-binding protein [Phascolarctobacterium sp.]|nr:ABC transporter substrate-binding protein [Phascolarctobacterium sp.]
MFNSHKKLNALFLALSICFLICSLLVGCAKEKAKQSSKSAILVEDSLGRRIALERPLQKVVVANAYNTDLTELIVALGSLDTIVGVDQNILWNNEAFQNKFTQKDLICARDGLVINYERVIDMKPDALIISSRGSWHDAEEKLKGFGIKVIVVDTHDMEKFSANCQLLGKIFGKEERAQEIENYYGSKLAYVKQQLANVKNRKTVYFECGSPGATTMKGSYFYSMVKYTGGINIMDDAVERHIVPEAVIIRNPQMIVKMSDPRWKYSYKPPTLEEQLAIRKELVNRPGWNEIEAVKKNNIFQLSYFSHCGAAKIVGVLYVAKFLYPELLPDLHPEEAFKVWVTKYLNLEYLPGHTYPKIT